MTFTECQTLLEWARTNRVAQLKIASNDLESGVEALFFPEKEQAPLLPAAGPRNAVDKMLFGQSLDDEDK